MQREFTLPKPRHVVEDSPPIRGWLHFGGASWIRPRWLTIFSVPQETQGCCRSAAATRPVFSEQEKWTTHLPALRVIAPADFVQLTVTRKIFAERRCRGTTPVAAETDPGTQIIAPVLYGARIRELYCNADILGAGIYRRAFHPDRWHSDQRQRSARRKSC